jgi:hypothetical protein
MRGVTIAVLGAVTAAAVVGAGVSIAVNRPATTLAQGQRLFAGLDQRLGDAESIEIAKHDVKFTIVRHGDAWVVPDKSDYPARADMVRKALVGLAELETVEAKTANPKLYGRLDLDDLTAVGSKAEQVTVKDGKGGVLAALLVGKKRTPPVGAASPNAADMLYVRKAGEPQTWLVQGQLEVRDSAIDWTERDVVDLAGEKIATLDIQKPGDKPVALFHDKPEDKDFKLRDMPAGKVVKSQYDLNTLADVLASMTFDDVAKDGAFPVGPAKATDRFVTKDGMTVTLTLLPKDSETWVKIEASGAGDAAAPAKTIAQRTAGWLYKLPDYKRDKLMSKLDDLVQDPPKPAASKPAG